MAAYPLNREEFEARRAAGQFNPRASYEDYQAMIQERVILLKEAEATARREGYELGAPELELTAEDEAILDRAWAKLAAERRDALSIERAA